jgi:hypothetical protein
MVCCWCAIRARWPVSGWDARLENRSVGPGLGKIADRRHANGRSCILGLSATRATGAHALRSNASAEIGKAEPDVRQRWFRPRIVAAGGGQADRIVQQGLCHCPNRNTGASCSARSAAKAMDSRGVRHSGGIRFAGFAESLHRHVVLRNIAGCAARHDIAGDITPTVVHSINPGIQDLPGTPGSLPIDV